MTGKRSWLWWAPLGVVLLAGALVAAWAAPGEDVQVFAFGGGAWLGVQVSDVTPEKVRELKLPGEYGVVIEKVEENSPAAKAGLRENDVILSFADERVRSVAHLTRLIRETPPGRKVTLQVSRGGQTRSVEVTPEERRARLRMPDMPMKIEIPPIEVPDIEVDIFRHGPRLGVSADELTPQLAEYFGVKQGKGVLVREVLAGSPAAKAGLKAGDVIVRVNDEEVGDIRDLRRALRRERETRQVTLTIVRNRNEQTLKVELEESKPSSPRRTAASDLGIDSEQWERWAKEMKAQAKVWEEQARRWEQEYRDYWKQQAEEWKREMERLKQELRRLEDELRTKI